MNTVVLMGRLTKDPDVRTVNGANGEIKNARYTLAVDRRVKKGEQPQADFIPCIAWGYGADFADKYLFKGTKVVVSGRIQTGSYTNKDGQKVYTTDVVVESQEFAESKASAEKSSAAGANGFMNIPDGIQEELPFN